MGVAQRCGCRQQIVGPACHPGKSERSGTAGSIGPTSRAATPCPAPQCGCPGDRHAHPERGITALGGQSHHCGSIRIGNSASMGGVFESPGFHRNIKGQGVVVSCRRCRSIRLVIWRGSRHGHGVEGGFRTGFRLHLDGFLRSASTLDLSLASRMRSFKVNGARVIGEVMNAANGADFIAFAEEGRRFSIPRKSLSESESGRWPVRPAFPPCNRARSAARRWWFPAWHGDHGLAIGSSDDRRKASVLRLSIPGAERFSAKLDFKSESCVMEFKRC